MERETFSTKIAVIIDNTLLPWQELNVCAFLGSAVASHFPETMGPDFISSDGAGYLGIFRHPVLIYSGEPSQLKNVYSRARKRNLHVGIYTKPIFTTQGDENLEAVKALSDADQELVGLVIYGAKGLIDKSVGNLPLHK